MNIFLVIPTFPLRPELGATIEAKFKDEFYKLPNGEWLVAFDGTTQGLSDELGITDGSNGTGIVAMMSGYYGRAPTDIWEWLKTRFER